MRPGPAALLLTTVVAGAVSVPFGDLWTQPPCPPIGSGVMMACLSPGALVPAFIGVGAGLALGPAVLVALTFATTSRGVTRTASAWSLLFVALGAVGVLGTNLLLGLAFPSVAQRALTLIVGLGLAVSLGLDGVYVVVRRHGPVPGMTGRS